MLPIIMDLSILHSFILVLLFEGISCQYENEGIELDLEIKVAKLKEQVTSLLESNFAKEKQVQMLSGDIQGIQTNFQSKMKDLEQDLLFSKESLKNAIFKINKFRSYVNTNSLSEPVRQALVEFGVSQGEQQSDVNSKVPRAVVQNKTVAFSVVMGPHKENLAIHQTLKFDNIITNDGLGYDPNTSIFKAPVSGLYYFSVVIMSHAGEDIETEIVKNGQQVVNTYSGDSTTWNAGPQSTVLQLNVGDIVYIRMFNNPTVNNGNVRVFGYGWSSFNGFLISQ